VSADLIGCNVTTCPNPACNQSGVCQRQASEKTVEAVKEIIQDGVKPTRKRQMIAFTGFAGSGKSTAAAHLQSKRGFRRVRFAGPLKAMMRALGCTEAEVDGDRKELPCDLLGGKTPRHAMQTIGNEWGRICIGEDLWLNAWRSAVNSASGPVVVDDCRYPNEAAAIKAMGGTIVRIERASAAESVSGHISENHVLPFDVTIRNDGTEADLQREIDTLIHSLTWAEAAAA
jgi:hypothetical protein